jgi:outer membrane lipoprotein SlyB
MIAKAGKLAGLAAGAVLGAAACGTIGGGEQRGLAWVVESRGNAEALAKCIAAAEEANAKKYDAYGIEVRIERSERGWRVEVSDRMAFFGRETAMVVEVGDLPGGGARAAAYMGSEVVRETSSEARAQACVTEAAKRAAG